MSLACNESAELSSVSDRPFGRAERGLRDIVDPLLEPFWEIGDDRDNVIGDQQHPGKKALKKKRRIQWSVCERYSGAIFTFLSVTPVRDLPKYATLVVDKIAKSVAMLIYDILPVHLRGVARVHLGESATKDFFWEFSGIFSLDDLALGPYTTTASSVSQRRWFYTVSCLAAERR